MKTISKKIKSIYLLAMMAIISVCIAVFPVFKTEMVNAEEVAPDFCVKGAYIKVDTDEEKESVSQTLDNFALMFQARFSAATYTAELAAKNVRFGMAIGPKNNFTGITDYASLIAADKSEDKAVNVKVFEELVGTESSEVEQMVVFAEGEEEFVYEAGVYFNKHAEDEQGQPIYDGTEDWAAAYAKELAAMPFYIEYVAGSEDPIITFGPLSNPTTAQQATIATMMAETAKPANTTEATPYKLKRAVSDNFFTMMTGKTLTREYSDDHEIYLSQNKKVFLSDFVAGNTASSAKANQRFLRYWIPTISGKTAYSTSSVTPPYPEQYPVGSWLAGTQTTNVFHNQNSSNKKTYPQPNSINTCGLVNATVSSGNVVDRIADTTAIQKLIPGETYRVYRVDGNGNYYYFNYKVISASIMGNNNGSTHDAPLQLAATYNGESAGVKNSYFTLDHVGSTDNAAATYIMPVSGRGNVSDKTGYNGYYILGGDVIVEDPVNEFGSKTPNASVTSLATQTGPSQAQHLQYKTIAACKQAIFYDDVDYSTLGNVGFNGVFDGRGHTISNSFGSGGLFGVINGGTVKNLTLKGDLYDYNYATNSSGTATKKSAYTKVSYGQNSAFLAEVVLDGSTIENVEVELTIPAARSFNDTYSPSETITYRDMTNVPAIFAANGVHGENTTLKNIIVKCDALKYVGYSKNNYRAALNVDSDVNTENVFVIGSAYTNMSIDDDYTLTISTSTIPAGFEAGVAKPIADDSTIDAKYRQMIIDMYNALRVEDVSGQVLKIRFIEEPATGKFADVAAFNAYLDSNTTIKTAFTNTKMWTNATEGGGIVWTNLPTKAGGGSSASSDKTSTYYITAKTSCQAPDKLVYALEGKVTKVVLSGADQASDVSAFVFTDALLPDRNVKSADPK